METTTTNRRQQAVDLATVPERLQMIAKMLRRIVPQVSVDHRQILRDAARRALEIRDDVCATKCPGCGELTRPDEFDGAVCWACGEES